MGKRYKGKGAHRERGRRAIITGVEEARQMARPGGSESGDQIHRPAADPTAAAAPSRV